MIQHERQKKTHPLQEVGEAQRANFSFLTENSLAKITTERRNKTTMDICRNL